MTKLDVKFYSAWYCPFAQRTWMALDHLRQPYAYIETDPYKKSASWLDVSRGTGQVPVLEIGVQGSKPLRVPNSLRTLEYLDDACQADGGLSPAAAHDRAEARFWLDYQGTAIIPQFYRFLKAPRSSSAAAEARDRMTAGLAALSSAMSPSGPYFFGSALGVVDIAFAPFALRIKRLLSHYMGFELPQNGEPWRRFDAWWRTIESHPAFIGTMPERRTYDARLLAFYSVYDQGGGQDDLTA